MARPSLKVGVGLIGPGLIGRTFLRQLSKQKTKLIQHHNVDVQVLGISGSQRMYLDSSGIDLENWTHLYADNAVKADLDTFFREIKGREDFSEHVFVDSTAAEEVPEYYNRWFEAGCHVVTPNKKYGSGPLTRQFLYEATVGAGLPVISTLQGLLESGDEVRTIEGVFSGSLSFIFNEISKEKSFSQVVAMARELGYTEPDPRDDLAGMDVARKVVVLARECGIDIELSDLAVQSLVPSELQTVGDVNTFMSALPKFDDAMLKQILEAEAAGEVLRYVGVVNLVKQKCEVSLRRYPRQHALGGLSGADNIIILKTERYNAQPLVIQGPGAGAETLSLVMTLDSDLDPLAIEEICVAARLSSSARCQKCHSNSSVTRVKRRIQMHLALAGTQKEQQREAV